MFVLPPTATLLCPQCAVAGPPPRPQGHGPHGPPAHHGLRAWLHAKEAQLHQWGHAEKAKLKNAWRHKVVPHIVQLDKKLGAEWQKKAPQVAALLKQKAGAAFDKAVRFVSQQVNKKLQG